MKKITTPYGLWKSSITPALVAEKLRLSDVQYCGEGLMWLEGRPTGITLVHQSNGGKTVEFAPTVPPRGGLAYGGGEFHCQANRVVFAGKDGRIFSGTNTDEECSPITPAFGSCASPCISPDGKSVLFLHSDGQDDSIGLTDLSGNDWPTRLVHGADFYMQPAWHPGGQQITWVEWNAPHMAWDGSEVKLGRVDPITKKLTSIITIAGNNHTPVFQPEFSPDSRHLSFLQGAGDRDELILFDLSSGQRSTIIKNRILIPPAWVMGMRVYGWSADARVIYCIFQEQGQSGILQVDVDTGVSREIELRPYNSFSQISVAPAGNRFACLAASPYAPAEIIEWTEGNIRVVRSSMERPTPYEEISTAQAVQWKNHRGSIVHGCYFPPQNAAYTGRGLPPAIVHVHGGPTSQADSSFSFETAFFTNRGYAVLSVNYRGSTGYGREYQQALNHHWGEYDVEDTLSGAHFLIANKLADPDRLVIKGGSAGGYTLLNTLIRHPGVFKAAICSYPVANLLTIVAETFKFEAHYYDSLIGPFPAEKEKYMDWSPINHIDQLRTPMILFHGDSDQVVPQEQSDEIAKALQQNGIPHSYTVFPGEGHGWKKPETLETYFGMIEQFLIDTVVKQ
ncbi:MAG: hypothetical protein C0391_00690 [Anaerolinea sp.]|nr:hypothetical protein [Anaerolinea sp.]